MVESEILKGIVFSHFGEIGPEAKIWFPKVLDQEILLKISVKTISLLAGDSGETTNQIAFIQFPKYSLSAFVYLFGIPNEEVRGKNIAASISILIRVKYNTLFYMNLLEIEESIKEISNIIVNNEKKNNSSEKSIISFFYELKDKINLFRKHEITTFKIKDNELNKINDSFQEYKYKVGIVGASGVGKTALLLRFCEKAFREKYIATNGANINIKIFELENIKSRFSFNLFDISGKSSFLDMNSKLIKGCHALIFIYDITRLDSFNEIKFWYDWILSGIGYKIGVLVGNKIDLPRKINKEDAKTLARQLKLGYIETSAKNDVNIDLLFEKIARAILKLYKNE